MVERPGTAAGYLSCALVAAGRSATRYGAFFARWPVNQKRSALKWRVSSVPKRPATRSRDTGRTSELVIPPRCTFGLEKLCHRRELWFGKRIGSKVVCEHANDYLQQPDSFWGPVTS
jgi:hypothetical protein